MKIDTGKTITFATPDDLPNPGALGGRPIQLGPAVPPPLGGDSTHVYDPAAAPAETSAETTYEPEPGEEWPDGVVPLNYCVGWLLAVSGPNKGRSYELHACQNHVGRDASCGVRIMADPAISRNQVVIIYDSVENEYAIYSDRGSAISRLNGRRLTSSESPLAMGDVIELSPTTALMFVPACGEKFRWA